MKLRDDYVYLHMIYSITYITYSIYIIIVSSITNVHLRPGTLSVQGLCFKTGTDQDFCLNLHLTLWELYLPFTGYMRLKQAKSYVR